jgi:amino acid transporter
MTANDERLKRKLGPLSLAMLTFGNMIGSGWLFAAYYGAQIAGPLSLVSWGIAGIATVLVALVFIELGITRPRSGGLVRWPARACGPFMATMIGWAAFCQIAIGTPSEAAGLLQYGARWWPMLYNGEDLTLLGLAAATLLMAGFAALNYFGVTLLARVNNAATIAKLIIPVLTIGLLIASGFDTSNLSRGGGWAPYGASSALTAVVGGGMLYSFGGVQAAAMLSGEARRPRRDVMLGTFLGFGLAFLIYLGLQTTLLGTVPAGMLGSGWQGINLSSPFAQLALFANLTWLSWVLLADGFFSPAGSMFVGITIHSRITYGLAENRTLPPQLAQVHGRSGIPRRALILNLVVGVLCLLLFRNWQSLVSALGMFFAVGYVAVSVAVAVLRRTGGAADKPWLRGMAAIAPASCIVSSLLVYWSGWDQIKLAIVLFAIAVPLYAIRALSDRGHHARAVAPALWFFLLMLFIAAVSSVGSFGGWGLLPAPWDSVLIAVGAAGFYRWGVHAGTTWTRQQAHEDADTPPATPHDATTPITGRV